MKLPALFLALLAAGLGCAVLVAPGALAAEAGQAPPGDAAIAWGYVAAAVAAAASAIGAGIAVASVGSAAVGAITEKPELLGRMLILVGLAEGIAIYGLIVSVLILDRLAS